MWFYLLMLERFIELEGPDKGIVKDIDIAFDLAYIEDAWREEGDGRPMLKPPERPGKAEIHFRDILNHELLRLITEKTMGEINSEFDLVYNTAEARANDPENSDAQWAAYRDLSNSIN